MYEPQNGVTEGSPGGRQPLRSNAPLGKKDLAGIANYRVKFRKAFGVQKSSFALQTLRENNIFFSNNRLTEYIEEIKLYDYYEKKMV